MLLNLWATWCVPCREEMPALDKLQAALGGANFEVVAINIDRGGPDKARDFLKEIGVNKLALYTDPSGKLFSTIRAVGMPTTLLIDREGREIGRLVGPADWASPEAKTLIEAAIAAHPCRQCFAGSIGRRRCYRLIWRFRSRLRRRRRRWLLWSCLGADGGMAAPQLSAGPASPATQAHRRRCARIHSLDFFVVGSPATGPLDRPAPEIYDVGALVGELCAPLRPVQPETRFDIGRGLLALGADSFERGERRR